MFYAAHCIRPVDVGIRLLLKCRPSNRRYHIPEMSSTLHSRLCSRQEPWWQEGIAFASPLSHSASLAGEGMLRALQGGQCGSIRVPPETGKTPDVACSACGVFCLRENHFCMSCGNSLATAVLMHACDLFHRCRSSRPRSTVLAVLQSALLLRHSVLDVEPS